jgi:hypothetical protein
MRSCGNYVITPGLMDRMFAADTSGICNNDPIMNWTDEEVQRWGLRLKLKDGCSPLPLVATVALQALATVALQALAAAVPPERRAAPALRCPLQPLPPRCGS